MKLTKKDAEILMNDSQFMSELGKCLDNKKVSMELFKKTGFDISESEYEELFDSVSKFSQCSDEELKQIAGGQYIVTKVKKLLTMTNHIVRQCPQLVQYLLVVQRA